MRTAFVQALTKIAQDDPRVVLLTGDLGFNVLEPFAEKFPDRFFNAGVAEQNMIGMATGLAEAGFVPFVYSIVTFASLRAYEFIRNGPVLHQLPVRVIAVGGGFEYGHAGVTHFGLEDLGIMRLQPGLTIVAPADFQQARHALHATWGLPGPVYYRVGKDDKTLVPGLDGQFALGQLQTVSHGNDILIVAMGAIAAEAVAAVQLLGQQGIGGTVAIVSSFNPGPEEELAGLLGRFRHVMTVEAHYITGGVGSFVAEIIAERGFPCQLQRCGVRTMPSGHSDHQAAMEEAHGLSARALAQTAMKLLGRSRDE